MIGSTHFQIRIFLFIVLKSHFFFRISKPFFFHCFKLFNFYYLTSFLPHYLTTDSRKNHRLICFPDTTIRFYALMSAAGRNQGSRAKMTNGPWPLDKENRACLQLYYYMYGDQMGRLAMNVRAAGKWYVAWLEFWLCPFYNCEIKPFRKRCRDLNEKLRMVAQRISYCTGAKSLLELVFAQLSIYAPL